MSTVLGPLEFQLQEPLTRMAPNGNGAARTLTVLPPDTAMAAATAGIGRSAPVTTRSENVRSALNMRSEEERFNSFSNWPVQFMNKSSLAAAGFYYLNREDFVRCAFCGVEVGYWEEGDDPLVDHKRWSPACPYLRELARNVGKENGSSAALRNSYDVCGLYGVEIRPNSGPENGKNCEQHLLEQLGINKSRGPAHTAFASIDSRMNSFSTWPKFLKQRPEELSEAGFFYTGQSDQTYCFHCGGGLKDWQPTDDPWVEHSKWFPKCTYVILNKGKEFIQKASTETEPLISSQDVQKITIDKEPEPSVESAGVSKLQMCAEAARNAVDEGMLCKICFQEELGVVFLPCGHLVSCVKCAPALTTCAVCRKPFTATVRAFLS